MGSKVEISIVIPLLNEEKNIPILAEEIRAQLLNSGIEYECIWVDDGSQDNSWEQIKTLGKPNRGIRLARNTGQATAIMAGIESASHSLIVTLDADLQNDPKDILSLINELDENTDVVCGSRISRQDKLITRKFPSKVANYLARKFTGVPVSDLGCTLRIFRREVMSSDRILGEMHRLFIIHLFLEGARIKEIPVNHRERVHGVSKYGLERLLKFIFDLILVKALKYITNKPLYMFGGLAIGTLFLGVISLLSAVALRITNIKNYLDTSLISAAFILFSTSLILLSLGLATELIVRQMLFTGSKVQYRIIDQA